MNNTHKMIDRYKVFILFYTVLCVSLLYLGFINGIVKNIFFTTHTAYYNYLLDAFFHGRVNVFAPNHYDLSFFREKWFLYWGPAPVLFILPFYLIWGVYASDIFYTAFAGVINVVLFSAVLIAGKKYFKIQLSLFSEIFLLLSFAIFSPNFILSLMGQVWGTEQVIATFYLLLFYFFLFTYLNKRNIFHLILSVLFFNFAWLSRYTMLANGMLFLLPLLDKRGKKDVQRVSIVIILISSLFLGGLLSYNYMKFGNPFETGLRYHQGNIRYHEIIQKNALFSPAYFVHNFYYFFLNPVRFSLHPFAIIIDKEGNSIFCVYPTTLFLLFLYKKRHIHEKKIKTFLICSGIIISMTILFFLFYFATGWIQFGMRYFLDIAPLSYLLLLFVIEEIPLFVTIPVLFYGVFVNLFGVLSFYQS